MSEQELAAGHERRGLAGVGHAFAGHASLNIDGLTCSQGKQKVLLRYILDCVIPHTQRNNQVKPELE
jgi:hypothetical protein